MEGNLIENRHLNKLFDKQEFLRQKGMVEIEEKFQGNRKKDKEFWTDLTFPGLLGNFFMAKA